jgi:adenosylcobinamide-GDP ribazoletransferase
MNALQILRGTISDFLEAVQFLTRIPVPSSRYEPDSLSRAVKFFPVVGLIIGIAAALVQWLLTPHLPRMVTALFVVTFLVLITGCLHEDGLADTADGFGGGWDREQILIILKDSRIGSYGSAALTLSMIARVVLLASLPLTQIGQYLIAAHVLCRWTTLPLSYYLPPARFKSDESTDGQGARLAKLTTLSTLITGSLLSFALVGLLLHLHAILAIATAVLVTLLSGLYYKRRIDGVTGDCFGATNQLSEIFVYLCGVWIA